MVRKKLQKRSLFFLVLSLLLFACSDEKKIENPPLANQYLVESSLITEMTGDEVKTSLSASSKIASFISLFSFESIRVYKIVYQTTSVSGSMIQVSGALAYPAQGGDLPLVSYQHGTITRDEQAPSNFEENTEFHLFGSFMAGRGYAVIAPDYIGYGTSADIPHPYEHGTTLGTTSGNMVKAGKEFFNSNEAVRLNDKLFLTGYSEGGYATMSMHQYLEQETDIAVTISAPGAGAYHKTAFANHILTQDKTLDFLATYLWVIDAYGDIYSLDRPISYYVVEPYASALQEVNPREYGTVEFNKNPQKLFTTGFVQGVLENTDTEFIQAIADNNRFDWLPQAPIRLYHGTADNFVPFFNSQDAFDAMQANGADVQLIPLQGKNHATAVPDYLLRVHALFETMK